jgi:hypothetical protein
MADLTDPFLLDLLPDVVQPALELVDFADRASDDLVEKGVVDGHVGVQAVVRGLEVDRLLEELAGKRGRVQRIRSMDHGLPWSRIRRVGRGRRRAEDETVRERPVGSEFEDRFVPLLGRPFLCSIGGHLCPSFWSRVQYALKSSCSRYSAAARQRSLPFRVKWSAALHHLELSLQAARVDARTSSATVTVSEISSACQTPWQRRETRHDFARHAAKTG